MNVHTLYIDTSTIKMVEGTIMPHSNAENTIIPDYNTDKIPKKKRGISANKRQKRYEKSVAELASKESPMIPKSVFVRLVREIAQDCGSDKRFGSDTLQTLQSASEAFLTQRLMLAEKLSRHAGRNTTNKKDLVLACETLM